MRFTLLGTDSASNARRGRIETDHGVIETPVFMPVGTVGSVKGVYHRDLKSDIGDNTGEHVSSVSSSRAGDPPYGGRPA